SQAEQGRGKGVGGSGGGNWGLWSRPLRSLTAEPPESIASLSVPLAVALAHARSIATVQGRFGSWPGVPELNCVMDELAVFTHGTDYGMIAQEWKHFLLGCLTLDERSNRPQVISPVAGCDLASP